MRSYEGLEAANVYITDGIIKLTASDDGINTGGGSDQNVTGGPFGADQFVVGDYSIVVSGGTVILQAGGDDFDSNGNINISGGYVVSLINSSSDNGGMDCDGSIQFTGGTVIYGGTGTGGSPGEGSTQSYVFFDSGFAAGDELILIKGDQTLVEFIPDISCQYLAFSTPDIVAEESYTLYKGGAELTTATAGTGGSGMMGRPGGGGWNQPGGRR